VRILAAVASTAVVATALIAPAQADGPTYRYFKSRGNAQTPGAYWDPCQTIRYGIDFTYAKKLGMRQKWERDRWKSAVSEVGQAMNVSFRYVGPVKTRSARTRPRSISGVDLVITFGNAKARGRYGYRRVLKGDIAGVAGVQWRSVSRSRAKVLSGYVVIDAQEVVRRTDAWRSAYDARPVDQRPVDVVRSLYMHEFGHAVGLDHVKDDRQLMFPRLQPDRRDELGPGDRKGLRKLGRQRCF
jgi:hypothetical protein